MQGGLDAVKRIPILNVAAALDIDVHRNRAMCFTGHDSKPSLTFYPDAAKNSFYCFGCQIGGTTIDLVMKRQGVGFKEAVKWLEDQLAAGTSRASRPGRWRTYVGKAGEAEKTRKLQAEIQPDPDVYSWLMKMNPLRDDGVSYLRLRGFRGDIIKHFGVGQFHRPEGALAHAVRKWGESRLLQCGLVKQQDGPGPRTWGRRFVWWDNTILFPFVQDGEVVYIQGRRLSDSPPKYVNLHGVKRPSLFNRQCLKALKPGDAIYICEGIPDAISATQEGLDAVAVLGAGQLDEGVVREFDHLRVYIVPDRDEAGARIARKIQDMLMSKGKVAEILRLPMGKDLSDYLRLVAHKSV